VPNGRYGLACASHAAKEGLIGDCSAVLQDEGLPFLSVVRVDDYIAAVQLHIFAKSVMFDKGIVVEPFLKAVFDWATDY